MNAGQTCVAPDYVLVHRDVKAAFMQKLLATLKHFYGEDPRQSESYCRIINARHHARLASLLRGGAHGGAVVAGGLDGGGSDAGDARGPYLAPTVVDDPDPSSDLMQSEIFGPILPVVTVASADEAVAFVNARARPLALYVFAADADAEAVVARTVSGGACVNDTIFQISNPHLPFGGVGGSGMGPFIHAERNTPHSRNALA